ncbi:MAG: HAMP domain-containing protein [Planctomycetes bacterium]|nr:HAMP domain-containing protein [Planctomycetota bacterium]
MFRRIFSAYLGVTLTGLIALATAATLITRERMLGEAALRLRSEAHLSRWALGQPDPDAALKWMAAQSDTRLTLIAPDGTVLADSVGVPKTMENHDDRPEVRSARRDGAGTDVRRSGSVGVEYMYVAVAEPDGTVLRAALPLTAIDAELRVLYLFLAAAFGAVALAAAAAGWIVARGIVRPLRRMTEVAGAIAAGDFTRRAPLQPGPPELVALARSLETMSETLQRRLEALRAETARIQAVLGSLQDGVVALGADGRVEIANQAAGQMLGFSGEAAGRELWELLREPALASAGRAAQTGRPSRGTLEREGRFLEITAAPVSSGGGVLVVRDVTEERRYDALRREFVANVSHELRTPLTLIRGCVETLEGGALDDRPKAAEFLALISRHAQRLSALVEDLLELSRLDAGFEPRRAPTRLDELAARVRETLAPAAARKRIAVMVVAPPLMAEVDADMIERAVANLVDNAIKYTPEGGSVTVTVRAPGEIEVRDTGVGIPAEDQKRVFERFYRVDKSRSREAGGTGLGLAIVKHIAQLHGGEVTVESAPGKGSSFILRLGRGSG